MTVYRVVTRGFGNAFATYEEAVEELRRLRAAGVDDAHIEVEDYGESCYSWCVGAPNIQEYLKCLAECDERGVTITLPPPLTQEIDDLGV